MKTEEVLANEYYGCFSKFLASHNPEKQIELAGDRELAFTSKAPSLIHVINAYSKDLVIKWIVVQLMSISDFAIINHDLDNDRLINLAEAIIVEFYYMNADELTLFVYLFKTGCYGELHGVIDPSKVMASLREFASYRMEMLYRIEARKKSLNQFKIGINTITKEDSDKLKREAKNDISAFIKLFRGANIEGKEKELWEIWRKNEREGMQLIMG